MSLPRLQRGQRVWIVLGQRSDGVAATEGVVNYCDPPGDGCAVTVRADGGLLVSVAREDVRLSESQAKKRIAQREKLSRRFGNRWGRR